MANEDTQFDWAEPEADAGSADDTPSEASASASAPKEPKAKEPASKEPEQPKEPVEGDSFDYSDMIDKMDEDADMSGDSEPDDDDDESKSAAASKEGAESKSGAPKTGEATQEQMFRAAQLGLSLEDVKGLDERGLATAIRIAEKLKPADEADASTKKDEEEEPLFVPIEMELDEFDEDTQGLVKGLQEQFNKNMAKMAEKLKATQDTLGQSQENAIQEGQAKFFERFDNSVSELGEEWVDVFGDDPNKLDSNAPEIKNRVKLIDEMDRLATSHPEYEYKELFDAAMRLTFSDQLTTKSEQRKKTQKSNYRQDRTTMKPTQRVRSIENMPEGREKALAMVKEIGKKNKKFFGLW